MVSAAKFFGDVEDQATRACFECAIRNGHTVEEAENCDDGNIGCPNCPFLPNHQINPDRG